MNKWRYIPLLSLFVTNLVESSCAPTSVTRIWNEASDALTVMASIESKLVYLIPEITNDFNGTFTVIEQIHGVVNNNELLTESINSNLDQLIVLFDDTLSKFLTVESAVAQVVTEVELISVDMQGTFTALDAFKKSIGSRLDLIARDLQLAESEIELLITTDIEHQITLSSHLSVLQTDINLLNSALDGLSIIDELQQIDSSIEILFSLTGQIANNVNNLESTIYTDFNGTWTALDSQLQLAGIIESLAENIHVTNLTDLSGVFTGLAMLQQTIDEIDSLVDVAVLVDNQNLMLACSIESEIELALSKLSIAQAELLPLVDLNTSTISLLSSDSQILSEVSSAVDVGIALLESINSQIDTIISKVSVIDNGLLYSNSTLPLISNNLITIESKLTTLNTSSSLLSSIDSKLHLLNNESFTIESIVDHISSQLGILAVSQAVSRSALIATDLSGIQAEMLTVSSQVDQLILAEDTINSNVDGITRGVQSSLSLASTIESKVNAIESIVEVASGITLNSKLAVINNEVITISSKMSIIDSKIPGLIFTAQDMVTDFQETWTILQSISNILTSDQLGLQTVSSKIHSLDLSGVYTIINSIIVQESTINTKVDTANSLADRLNQLTDFSTVFTALNGISANMNTINSQVDRLNTDVNTLQSYLGTPIYQRDFGVSGYTISRPGRYYLAENITYASNVNTLTISSNDVILDLNQNQLQSNISDVITINANNNIQVLNGTIISTNAVTGNGLNLKKGGSNIILKDLLIWSNNPGIVMTDITNILIENCMVRGANLTSIIGFGLVNATVRKINYTFAGFQIFPDSLGLGVTNLCITDCNYVGNEGGFSTYGFACQGANRNVVLQNLILSSNLNNVFAISHKSDGGNGLTMKDCSLYGFGGGISVEGPDLLIKNNIERSFGNGIRLEAPNSAILFNTLIQNSPNIYENVPGPNTYLGNFAFSSAAVGNPNNTNYTITGASNITNKYQTVKQTGSFGDYVTGWHNINMLP